MRKTQKLSSYYLADEISSVYRGMSIAIPQPYWQETFGPLKPQQLAKKLLWLGKKVDDKEFLTNPWSNKPPPKTKRSPARWGSHVSTQQLLDQRT